jgi:C4-dicarboxylate-specific signal transduction histidine kinase
VVSAFGLALFAAVDFILGRLGGSHTDLQTWFILFVGVSTGALALWSWFRSGILDGLWRGLSDPDMREILFRLDRTEANLQMQERYAVRGYLAAGVVHEFKNILSLVRVCADFGLSGSTLQAKDKALSAVLSNVDTGTQTVLSMLEALAFKGRRKRKQVRLGEMIESLVSTLRSNYRVDEIEFSLTVVDDAAACIRRDEIEQALLNLIRNAAEAFRSAKPRERKKIEIEVSRSKKSVLIELADNAGGIPEDVQAALFDAPSFLKPKGLGLFLARKAIQENGGRIDFQPTTNGSRFRLVFPEI